MKYGSVCSGIEAATVAWHPLGWEPSFFSEIDPFPCGVLKHHYPDIPLFGDINNIRYDSRVNLLYDLSYGCPTKELPTGDINVPGWFICPRCRGLLWNIEAVDVDVADQAGCGDAAAIPYRDAESLLSGRGELRQESTSNRRESHKKGDDRKGAGMRRVQQDLCSCEREATNRGTSRRLQSPAECAVALSKLSPQVAQDLQCSPCFVDVSDLNLIVGGFPCQDLSVAGNRKGLINDDGETTRSGLFYRIAELCDAIGQQYVVLENVPGIFSSREGRDFAAVVGELSGSEVGIPNGGWENSGFALGPKGLVEWATLDAQYFGVAQRRRRVFIIRDSGEWQSRPPILLERHSLQGHPAPSREKGEGVARGLRGRANSSHREDSDNFVVSTHRMRGFGDYALDDVASTVKSRDAKDATDLIALPSIALPINTQIATRHKKMGRGTGFGVGADGDPAFTLQSAHSHAVAFQSNATADQIASAGQNICPAMVKNAPPAVACFSAGQSSEAGSIAYVEEQAPTLRAGASGTNMTPTLHQSMTVRRLTPTECSRLQQFPDDYLELKYASANEAHPAQILHTLWREIGAKGLAPKEASFPKNGGGDVCEKHRVAASLFTPQVLLAGVYMGWVPWGQARKSAERSNIAYVGKAGWTKGFVRGLREAGEAGRTPYKRESYRQLAAELGYTLQELPLEKAQAGKILRDSRLWQEAQRAWPLRYALATEKERAKDRLLTPDGPRYKALGNSMAVPVMSWIGQRIEMVREIVA